MAQEREIQYSNKTFSDFRQQLIDYAKNYFPDTYNDFSPTSPGMMFVEMASYVGDILSFYQDIQLQETFLNTLRTWEPIQFSIHDGVHSENNLSSNCNVGCISTSTF